MSKVMTSYPVDEKTLEQINNAFVYHQPFGDQQDRYESLRFAALVLARMIVERCPPSRERSLALTNLEQTAMWANASIARNEKP